MEPYLQVTMQSTFSVLYTNHQVTMTAGHCRASRQSAGINTSGPSGEVTISVFANHIMTANLILGSAQCSIQCTLVCWLDHCHDCCQHSTQPSSGQAELQLPYPSMVSCTCLSLYQTRCLSIAAASCLLCFCSPGPCGCSSSLSAINTACSQSSSCFCASWFT